MYQKILEEAKELKPVMTDWRRSLHRIPEIGLCLPKTSAFIQERLREMDIPFEVTVDGSCVVGLIGSEGPCILLRADMDALPFKEESGEAFASENGYMHACGHDMHAAALLGAAKILKSNEKSLPGQVKLLFQPGEENFLGAAAAIKDGVLNNPAVEAAYAMHVVSIAPVGMMIYGKTPMSSVYGFKIHLKGQGGHGSSPELCIDPITTGVHIHLALQELMARECPFNREAALTIGQFKAGDAPNVIPDTAILQGTLRTFDNEVAQRLITRIGDMVRHIAAAYRTEATLEVLFQGPVLTCDDSMNDLVLDCLKEMGMDGMLHGGLKGNGSEDFACIAQQVPSSYFSIGAGVGSPEQWKSQHHPKVRFNEDALPKAAALYAAVAFRWLNTRI